MSYDRAREEYFERSRLRHNRLTEIALQINRQWWRVFRNRRLRREVARLSAEGEAEFEALRALR